MKDKKRTLFFGITALIVCIGYSAEAQNKDISFSHSSGFYETPFDLVVTTSDTDASIVYTLNGSNPQFADDAFTGSNSVTIPVDPDSNTGRANTPGVVVRVSINGTDNNTSYPVSRTYIFPEKVKSQVYPDDGWPDMMVNDQVLDYEMDPEVIDDDRYTGLIDDALYDIPTISIVTNVGSLFDPDTGIYVNAEGHGHDWERECSVELFDPNDTTGFHINAGLRIRGGWSRHSNYPKHAFRLFFRSDYGAAKLRYPVFGDEGTTEYDKLDLRTAQNYAWNNGSDRNTMAREVFSRDSQKDMGQPYTRSRYYHLYLNGVYWGIYQSQERAGARYASDYFGNDREDYDVVKVDTEDFDYRIEATDGNLDAWRTLWDMCNEGFESNSRYFALEGKNSQGKREKHKRIWVDIDNLIDYMIGIFYAGNFDAPVTAFGQNKGPNNFYAIFNRHDRSKGFVFFNHDAEHSLMYYPAYPGQGIQENRVNIADINGPMRMEVNQFSSFHPQWLHHKLTDNTEYRVRFADRAHKHLTGSGVFTPSQNRERFDARASQIDTAIIAESARWGDAQSESPFTKDDHWVPQLEILRDLFFPERTTIVINQLKNEGLFSDIKAPQFVVDQSILEKSTYDVGSSTQVELKNPSQEGIIYYTLNNADPRNIGGSVFSGASEISSGNSITINGSAILKARIHNNGEWSALKQVTLISDNDDLSRLKVTELHYHPPDVIEDNDTTSGTEFEFLEFKNTGETSLNLSGLVLDSAIRYTFPDHTILAPQNFYVVASDPDEFYLYTGQVASGNYKGHLSNGGEEILLEKGDGTEIIRFTYSDDPPWEQAADGSGYSLVSTEFNPTGDPGDHSYWRRSFRLHGSPFSDDTETTDITPHYSMMDNMIRVYPNPVSEYLYIERVGAGHGTRMQISLYNINGILIHNTAETGDNTSVNLSRLALQPGMYIVRVISGQQTNAVKIMYNP